MTSFFNTIIRQRRASIRWSSIRAWFLVGWITAPTIFAQTETSYHEQPIRFISNGKQIAGVLAVPEGKGPFPVVLFVAGSGPTGRYGSGAGTRRALWEAFARRG